MPFVEVRFTVTVQGLEIRGSNYLRFIHDREMRATLQQLVLLCAAEKRIGVDVRFELSIQEAEVSGTMPSDIEDYLNDVQRCALASVVDQLSTWS